MKIPGYQAFTRNREDSKGGGISSAVLSSDSKDCLKVSEGIGKNEFLIRNILHISP